MHGTITKHCRVCSKSFTARRGDAETCGAKCRQRLKRYPLSVTETGTSDAGGTDVAPLPKRTKRRQKVLVSQGENVAKPGQPRSLG
jgi:hypothetical protein